MKNLKKALSLVLASAMLIGMMVVGTGAAYSDVKAEHNEEAIAVVAEAGIMGAGDKFNPDVELTRGEMAVIMVNMLDLDTKDYKGAANFADAGWAADFIDACYAEGIMAGVSATEFGTNVKVTTAQAALMMMKALGYFQNASDFGQDWMLATIKQASKIDLLEGIDAKASAVMTRNEVAQLALNALEATMVELSEDATNTTITAGDVQVSISGNNQYADVANTEFHYDETADADEDAAETMQLIEKLFEDFTKEDTTDAYGRAAIEWLNDGESVVVVGEAADYTFVITEDTTLAEYIEDEKLDKKIELADDEDMDLFVGQVVELWVDDKALECDPVVYNYVLGQITEIEEVDEDLEEDEIEAGAKYWVTIDILGEAVLDIQLDGFNAETFVEDAYIVMPEIDPVAKEFGEDDYEADVYADVTVAESFEGKVTAIGADYIRVDGSKTNVLAAAVIDVDGNEADIEVKKEYTFYKDVNGIILLAAEVEDAEDEVKLDDVVYVVNVYDDGGKTDKYGNEVTTYYAQIMNMEGEVEDIVIGFDGKDDEETEDVYEYGVTEYEVGGLYTAKEYTAKKVIDGVNYKGTTKLTEWVDEDYAIVETGAVEVEKDDKKIGDVRLNSKVTFILVEGSEDEIEVAVKAGKQNITLTEDSFVIAEIDDDDNQIAVYVIVPDGEFSNKDEYEDVIYFDAEADTEAVVVEIDGDDYDAYTVEAYTEAGKAIALTLDEEYESGFYTYSIEDGIFTLEAVEAYDAEEEQDGELAGEYTGKYGTLATIGGEEIETEGATWIDLHDDEEGYPKSIKTLAALAKAVDNEYTVDLTVYVKDDAAVVIVVR